MWSKKGALHVGASCLLELARTHCLHSYARAAADQLEDVALHEATLRIRAPSATHRVWEPGPFDPCVKRWRRSDPHGGPELGFLGQD